MLPKRHLPLYLIKHSTTTHNFSKYYFCKYPATSPISNNHFGYILKSLMTFYTKSTYITKQKARSNCKSKDHVSIWLTLKYQKTYFFEHFSSTRKNSSFQSIKRLTQVNVTLFYFPFFLSLSLCSPKALQPSEHKTPSVLLWISTIVQLTCRPFVD